MRCGPNLLHLKYLSGCECNVRVRHLLVLNRQDLARRPELVYRGPCKA